MGIDIGEIDNKEYRPIRVWIEEYLLQNKGKTWRAMEIVEAIQKINDSITTTSIISALQYMRNTNKVQYGTKLGSYFYYVKQFSLVYQICK